MRISTLFYTIKQGFANIFRNKWYSIASIATISACLFLFGIFYAIVAMTITYNGITYSLAAGENKIYSIALGEGEHTLTFEGNGIVSVEYRGGRL